MKDQDMLLLGGVGVAGLLLLSGKGGGGRRGSGGGGGIEEASSMIFNLPKFIPPEFQSIQSDFVGAGGAIQTYSKKESTSMHPGGYSVVGPVSGATIDIDKGGFGGSWAETENQSKKSAKTGFLFPTKTNIIKLFPKSYAAGQVTGNWLKSLFG